jgi:hypothetical protein
MNRRGFLRTTALSAALLGAALGVGRRLSGYRVDPDTAQALRTLSEKEFVILLAISRRILAPDAPDAPPVGPEVVLFIDRYLGGIDEGLRDDVRALLHLVEHASGLSRFTRMTAAAQDEVLQTWQASRLAVRRQGLQALRSLAFFGYWRDPRTFAMLGYSGPMLPRAPG